MIGTDDIYSTPPPARPSEREGNATILFLMVVLLPLVGSRLVDPATIGRSLLDVVAGAGLVTLVVTVEVTRRRRRREALLAYAEALDETVEGGARVRPGLARLRRSGDDERSLGAGSEKKVGQRVGRLVVDL